METIAQLRERLQGNKRARMKTLWGHRFFNQGPPIYITWLLIKINAKITPNQITAIMLIESVVAALLMLVPGVWPKVLGLFLLWFSLILDGVDGEWARHTRVFSLKGLYLDAIYHLLTPPLFLISLGWGIAQTSTNPFTDLLVLVAGIGGIGWMIVKANSHLPFQAFAKHYLKKPENFPLPEVKKKIEGEVPVAPPKRSLLRRMLGVRFQIRQFFIALVIFLITLLVDYFVYGASYVVTSWVLLGYSAFLGLHALEEITKHTFMIEPLVANMNETLIKKEGKRDPFLDQSCD